MLDFIQDAFSTFVMFLTARDSYEKYIETQKKILDLKPSWARFIISLVAQNHLKRRSLAKRVTAGTTKGTWWGPGVQHMTEEQITAGDGPIMLYIHGGAFTVGHTKMWSEWCCDLTQHHKRKFNKDFRIFTVDYTLAPDAHFPTQHTECLAAIDYLVRRCKVNPLRIFISGDSAGGNLALQTMYEHHDAASFGGAVLFSPWGFPVVSLHQAGVVKSPVPIDIKEDDSYYVYGKTDYVTDLFAVQGIKAYMGPNISYEDAFRHKGLNPFLRRPEDVAALPATIIVYGGSEKLKTSIESWHKENEKSFKDCEMYQEAAGVHDWPLSRKLCKDPAMYERGLERVSSWIEKKMIHGGK
ncbi:Alpha/Beta hydrolase protein [Protomyces lactucae-debilis]|uniref:Alpha/Beta hydrolase protein n=1 Tax=Protomyces lactucae-debilis TaxID=2754530 RepID=A0A1Y2FLT9_PROLT|nr:Alpha/Beta hydrolase protein [Protomyces lactucae-debilis]ORY84918.1 Alpha/Beta hydrolase protein [Protomyces lactucae-debilis]